jgi:chemotaxis protein CheX
MGSTETLEKERIREGRPVVRLAETLDLNAAEPLRQALAEQRGRPVALDGSQVARLGGLCLQVLVSAHKTWVEDGQEFHIDHASPELIDQLRLLGSLDLCADPFNPNAFGGKA